MLKSLTIQNYALIEHIEIEFDEGLNIVTGETGAGKSIVLDALALLMGERADTRTIRSNERKTVVEAVFTVGNYDGFNEFLTSLDIDTFDDSCILRREISVKGSSRSFINDTPVNLATMKEVSGRLLDIHTQHENLLLTDSSFQMQILDSLADNKKILDEYKTAYADYREILKEYTLFRDSLKRSKSEEEFNRYLLEQLLKLNLQPGEQLRLEQERDIVANATEIRQHLTTALQALSDADTNALALLSAAEEEIEGLSEFVADSQSLCDRLNSARIEINDIVETLREYENTITATDNDLLTIDARLGEIYALQSRHNVSTDAELIALQDRLKASVNEAENGDERLAELEGKAKAAKKKVVLIGRALSEARSNVAKIFANDLKERAIPMGMNNLRCEIRVTQDKLRENGMDNVDFLFAFNKNQSLMPIGKTASGGEISRVILALKSILVEKMQLPTIIFDEVDTGVSGDVANRMAKLMLEISRKTQVITITHIATVAAHGHRHFKVYKQDDEVSTSTHIKQLGDDERVRELAAMISGDSNDENALVTARTLLDKSIH